MQTVLIILTVLISILLIIVVLVQKSKGGGLASNFAGSNQIMGVRRTNDFIEKATWTLAGIICVLALISGIMLTGSDKTAETRVKAQPAAQEQPADFATPTTVLPTATDNAAGAQEQAGAAEEGQQG